MNERNKGEYSPADNLKFKELLNILYSKGFHLDSIIDAVAGMTQLDRSLVGGWLDPDSMPKGNTIPPEIYDSVSYLANHGIPDTEPKPMPKKREKRKIEPPVKIPKAPEQPLPQIPPEVRIYYFMGLDHQLCGILSYLIHTFGGNSFTTDELFSKTGYMWNHIRSLVNRRKIWVRNNEEGERTITIFKDLVETYQSSK